MINSNNSSNHEYFLNQLSDTINLPEDKYEEAVGRYESLGKWLERSGSKLAAYKPLISPQGSFLLGTANRPKNDNEEYDIDLICRLELGKSNITQKQLKEIVGKEILEYAKSHNMQHIPENKRRCWTLEYADGTKFHLDILPCIPDMEQYRNAMNSAGFANLAADDEITKDAIAITDKTNPFYAVLHDDWPSSNPIGYSAWFKRQMAERFRIQKAILAAERSRHMAKVEDVPDYKIKTTLQKVIQLLKRHRDNMFAEDLEHKPISIIITTLAAQAYQNEEAIVDALQNILTNMDSFIVSRGRFKWIENPVNPLENFADKWAEEPKKEAEFFRWLTAARRDFGEYLNASTPDLLPEQLAARLGKGTVETVFAQPRIAAPAVIIPGSRSDRLERAVDGIRERGAQSAPWYFRGVNGAI